MTREGGLDLSRREVAFKGGDSGTPIVSGNADESLIWQYVDSDEMPLDRPPLSKDQKKLLIRLGVIGGNAPEFRGADE